MSNRGTDSHTTEAHLPDLVSAAVALAVELDFPNSCRIEQGRLLHALAAGASGRIGETGTGCGVGLAWLVSGARPGVRVVSVERDAERAERAGKLFAEMPDVTIIRADWTAINDHGPFDLLVVDGGGNGKKGGAVDPERMLTPGGVLVIDDFTPLREWPPTHEGAPDRARLSWLEHPALLATEIRLAPDLSTVVAVRRP
ncbi:class I SAM-dependent methyltransferase [Micromonospora sp. WMMD1102]|uniref:O-methyltransferase n=1 Tax=Micromonospora sp. WMMD1102 TaxID=3016105 RepID=UPI00241515E3|nr:class I SAM-dependent methyltransferase [Micromonospora sp. WMMD1102]MDG4788027.1 class I SAM-dependent methyltransferase [Micromonospora sp. WMMD1102]